MSETYADNRVYYHYVEGGSLLLADERDKWRLLEAVRAIQQKKDWVIYAFCLTDSGAYFITETAGIAEIQKQLRQIVKYVGETAEHTALLHNLGSLILCSGFEELESLHEVVRKCIQLHQLPLEYGYVSRITDYWWSSYNSYMGLYHWTLVNCCPVCRYFSEDTEEARCRFRRSHTKEVKMK